MNKNVVWALLLMAISMIVIVMSNDRVEVNLVFDSIKAMGSLVYLAFLGVGVAIGMLLK